MPPSHRPGRPNGSELASHNSALASAVAKPDVVLRRCWGLGRATVLSAETEAVALAASRSPPKRIGSTSAAQLNKTRPKRYDDPQNHKNACQQSNVEEWDLTAARVSQVRRGHTSSVIREAQLKVPCALPGWRVSRSWFARVQDNTQSAAAVISSILGSILHG